MGGTGARGRGSEFKWAGDVQHMHVTCMEHYSRTRAFVGPRNASAAAAFRRRTWSKSEVTLRIAAFSGGVGAGAERTVCQAQPHELPSNSTVALYTAAEYEAGWCGRSAEHTLGGRRQLVQFQRRQTYPTSATDGATAAIPAPAAPCGVSQATPWGERGGLGSALCEGAQSWSWLRLRELSVIELGDAVVLQDWCALDCCRNGVRRMNRAAR